MIIFARSSSDESIRTFPLIYCTLIVLLSWAELWLRLSNYYY